MKKQTFSFLFIIILFAYCSSKPSFTEQVRKDFTNRVLKTDSAVRVDSFQLVRIDSITEKIGQIVYDSIFAREEARLESELNAARINKGDTGYIQEEISYMKKEMDSIGNLITRADTVKKYGLLGLYSYTISKNEKFKTSQVYYFISNNGNVLNPDLITDYLKVIIGELK